MQPTWLVSIIPGDSPKANDSSWRFSGQKKKKGAELRARSEYEMGARNRGMTRTMGHSIAQQLKAKAAEGIEELNEHRIVSEIGSKYTGEERCVYIDP